MNFRNIAIVAVVAIVAYVSFTGTSDAVTSAQATQSKIMSRTAAINAALDE